MRRKAIQPSNPSEVANPKKSKTRRRVLKTVRNLLKILSKRADNVQKPRGRGRPPKIKSEHPIINPEDEGVTFKQIETWFKRKWPDQKGEADIQTAVLEEVAEGRLVILPNKKYILKNWRVTVKDITIKLPENDLAEELVLAGAAAKDQVEDPNKMAVSSSHLSNSCIPFRTDEDNSAPDLVIEEEEQANHKRKSPITAQHTSLVKKFKLENGEDIRLIRTEGSEVKNVCGTCDLTEDCNSSGEAEPLLTCKDCNISFHPSCLSYPKELAERASKYPWECASCKTCLVCGDAEEEQMLICDSCDRGYHMQCHDPPVSDKISSDEWLCSSCLNDSEESNKEEQDDKEHSSNNAEEDVSRDVNNSAGPKSQASTSDKQGSESVGSQLLPTPNSSPSRTAEAEEDLKNISTIDFPLLPKLILSVPGDPPNATNWTVEDVHGYFTKAGFSLQAETFKNEEIDGKALLLLTRPDVLSGMKFKLGPALKIYAHIQRIQESSFPE